MQNISQPFLDLMKTEKLNAEPANPMFKRRKKKKNRLQQIYLYDNPLDKVTIEELKSTFRKAKIVID